MTKSKTLYEREGERDLAAVAAFLHELADQMAAGTLSLGDKNGGKALHLPEEVGLEVTLERDRKKGKRARYSLEIELAWKAAKKAREAKPEEEGNAEAETAEAEGEDVGKALHMAADEASRVKAETEASLPNAEPAAEEIKAGAEAGEQEAAEAIAEEEPPAEMEEAKAEAGDSSEQEIPLLENPDRPLLDAGKEG